MKAGAWVLSAPHKRRAAWWAVLLAVLLVHACMGREVLDSRLGEGAAERLPPTIEVAFVQELAPTAVPVHAAATPPTAAAAPTAADPAPPASSPASAAAEPALPPSAPDTTTLAQSDATPTPTPPASAATPADASTPAAFDWPPSTRLSYNLKGEYRGPLYGSADVEWRRQAEHYQVRVTVRVSPVFERRMVSDGLITPEGLSPRRYDEETEVALQSPRRGTLHFDAKEVQLITGKTVPTLPGVQDSASQFVQLTWLFLTHPERAQVGEVVQVPLALPRRVAQWTYDITEASTLEFPFGPLETLHLTPRPDQAKANEVTVDIWVAPTLQYLPVRLLLRLNPETWLDLMLAGRPLQAASPGASGR